MVRSGGIQRVGYPLDFTGMAGTGQEQDREPLNSWAFFEASLKRLEETYRKERDYQDIPHHGASRRPLAVHWSVVRALLGSPAA